MQLELTFGEPVERCPVCLAVHPACGWYFIHRKRFAPCSWCGTDWSEAQNVEPFTSRQRGRLYGLGWTWQGTGRSTELALTDTEIVLDGAARIPIRSACSTRRRERSPCSASPRATPRCACFPISQWSPAPSIDPAPRPRASSRAVAGSKPGKDL